MFSTSLVYHAFAHRYNADMPISLNLKDNEYEYKGVKEVRKVARGIVLDDKGNVAIHTVSRDDIFCKQTYYETPGGGVDKGETYEQALLRECDEELGYEVEILAYVGEVNDYYNLIGRENHNRYYLCKLKNKRGVHMVSKGDSFIKKTEYLPFDEVISLFEKQSDRLVAGLVKRRELPIIKEAKRIFFSL